MGFPGVWTKSYHRHVDKRPILKDAYDLTVEALGNKRCIFRFQLEGGTELPIEAIDEGRCWIEFSKEVADGAKTYRYSGLATLGQLGELEMLLGVIWRRSVSDDPWGPDEDMGTFTAIKRPGPEPPESSGS